MEIRINGETRAFDKPMTVAELLRVLSIGSRPVVVERNLEIVPRDRMDDVMVCDGDHIEIVRFVGGG